MVDPEALKVISFLAILAGGFLGLLWVTDQAFQWAVDNGWFWHVCAILATVVLMANIWSTN